GRDKEGVPAPGPKAPSRRQPRGQDLSEALPGNPGGVRGPEGRREETRLRPVRPRRLLSRFRRRVRGGLWRRTGPVSGRSRITFFERDLRVDRLLRALRKHLRG